MAAHSIVVGMTENGKTTLCTLLDSALNSMGQNSAVLDPDLDHRWKASFITQDADKFLQHIKTHKNLICWIDEGGRSIGRNNSPMHFITTTSRKLGHSAFIIIWHLTDVDPTLRHNCGNLYLFHCSLKSAKLAADEWAIPPLIDACRLPVGEFFYATRQGILKKGKIRFDKGEVTYKDISY